MGGIVIAVMTGLISTTPAIATAEEPTDPPVGSTSPYWDAYGPPTESIVPASGGGYWTAFSGVGVRGVLGAETPWTPPAPGTASASAGNSGGIVVPNLEGSGFWVVAASGLIAEYGGAPTLCQGNLHNCGTGFGGNAMSAAAVPGVAGGGFLVVNDDGRVYGTPGVTTYGDWTDGGHVPVAIVATPTGKGYYILEKDGGIANKGDAVFFGAGRDASAHTWTGMSLSFDSAGAVNGYWTITTDGTLYPYGAAVRNGYTGSGSLDLSHGPVRGIAPYSNGTGFAVLQQDGQVSTFPDSGAQTNTTYPTKEMISAQRPYTPEPVTFEFTIAVKNESSEDVHLVPYSATNTDPRTAGTGFSSTASDQYAAMPWNQTTDIPAGATSATWPISTQVFVSDPTSVQTPQPAEIQFDITPTTDPSDRQRVELSQARQSIMQQYTAASAQETVSSIQLLGSPTTTLAGSGSFTVTIEDTLAYTGDYSAAWTLVIRDTASASSVAPTPAITQLSAPFDASVDTGQWATLAQPIYRIDVPAFTTTWTDDVPGRITIEPATVTAQPGGQVLGKLVPTSVPVVDGTAKTVSFGAANFYFQQFATGTAATSLTISGGWYPESTVAISGASSPPSAPAGVSLGGLTLAKSTQNTPAVPNNGIGAQLATLSLTNHNAVVPGTDPTLGWLYNHIYFVDGDNQLLTGLDTGSGYTAVSTVPALQVVDTQTLTAQAAAAATNPTSVWVTSSLGPIANQQVSPRLATQISNSSGSGSTASNYSAAASLTYETYDPYGATMVGDLTDGVTLGCVQPGGSTVPCPPTYPGTTGGALYQAGATGPIRLLTAYHVLQATTDTSPPSTPILGMFHGAVMPNANQSAILAVPPSTGQLPSSNPNPLFEIALVTPGGIMVDGTARLKASTSAEPAFSADDPPLTATVGQPYSYTFRADAAGALRYEVRTGAVPAGLVLDPQSGELAGTPTSPGSFTFRVAAVATAADGDIVTEGGEHTIVVHAASDPGGGVTTDDGGSDSESTAAGERGTAGLAGTGVDVTPLLAGAILLLVLGIGAAVIRRRSAAASIAHASFPARTGSDHTED